MTAAAYAQDPGQGPETPQQFEGFDLSGYDESGAKSWDVQGDTADVFGEDISLTNINAQSYGKDPMNLTAERGKVNKATGNMHVEQDVVITTDSGMELKTDSLDWQRNDDLVSTDDPVQLNREGMEATGKGARARPGLNEARINEDVTVTMDTRNEDGSKRKIVITCDGPLEIDYQNQKAVFNTNVVARETDRELHADKMEVFFNTETSQITEMICTGHVVIVQGKNKTVSDKAVYSAVEQKLTLSGRPKLILLTEEGEGSPF